MKKVPPIKDKLKLEEIKTELLKSGYRNYLFFCVGIYTGMRVSDIQRLLKRDVMGEHIIYVPVKTEKTKDKDKEITVVINDPLRKALDPYVKDLGLDDYLFESRIKTQGETYLKRWQCWNIIKKACEKHGVPNAGTHTMRKTYGYMHYKKYKDIAALMKQLGHSTPLETIEYIGMTQEVLDDYNRKADW